MDAKSLIETLRARGVDLRVDGDGIRAEAPREPDPNTKALIDELCQCREEAKRVIQAQEDLTPIRAWVVKEVRGEDGELRAILICSALLEAHLWMILDRSFEPKDGLAVYYAEEIPLLRNRTPEEIREIHKVKIAFPGCRVIQEGPESRDKTDARA